MGLRFPVSPYPCPVQPRLSELREPAPEGQTQTVALEAASQRSDISSLAAN